MPTIWRAASRSSTSVNSISDTDDNSDSHRGRIASFFNRKSKSTESLKKRLPGRSPSPAKGFRRARSGSDSSRRSESPGASSRLQDSDIETENEGAALVTPENAFDDEEDEDDNSDFGSDDGYEEATIDAGQILTFRNTSYNTGDRPVMNILQSQSQLPIIEDDHPNMLEDEQPVFFVSPTTPDKSHQPFQRAFSKRRKEELILSASSPSFERNRCTITINHGDHSEAANSAKRPRNYLVASDLSTESSYAIEWCIGTVLRDGDSAVIVSVMETDTKLDDDIDPSTHDGQTLLKKAEKEREERCQLLSKQVCALLQRTRLHVELTCQSIHAKNARHMLVDMIDYVDPTLVIVGSRGLNKIKGMLLGSVSYYLVQKSSVPVMVARRRLRRQTKIRKSRAALDRQARVPLSQAQTEVESKGSDIQHEADKERTLELAKHQSVEDEDEAAIQDSTGHGVSDSRQENGTQLARRSSS